MSSRKQRIYWPRTLLAACREIEAGDGASSLADIAAGINVSASELHRQFTRRLGITPRAYAEALRLHRLARGGKNTLDAIYDAGFESVTTAYNAAARALGASPAKLRKTIDIGWWMGLSDLGWMLMAATDKGICWLAFGNEPGALLEEMRAAFPKARLHNDEERLHGWFEQVREFVLLPKEALDLPLDVQGTAFQASVWQALRRIPLGKTVSYTQVAKELDSPNSVRAVASACGRNPVALVIPCHRVLGSDGRLAGYRWGLERKARLLERERGKRSGESVED